MRDLLVQFDFVGVHDAVGVALVIAADMDKIGDEIGAARIAGMMGDEVSRDEVEGQRVAAQVARELGEVLVAAGDAARFQSSIAGLPPAPSARWAARRARGTP